MRFRTGSGLSFDIMVDRAMDLGGMSFRGVAIGWHSPTGFRSPWLHEADAEDGRAMPALFQWQNVQEGSYVAAIEPATVHGGSRRTGWCGS
jgi:hypothetical protein